MSEDNLTSDSPHAIQPGAGARREQDAISGSNLAQDGIERSRDQALDSTGKQSSSSPALARARDAGIDPSSKDARVSLIIELMGAGAWVSKVTPKELAELFGERGHVISWETIEHDGCEAARIVRLMSDPNFVRSRYWQRVEEHDRELDALVRTTIEAADATPPVSALDVKAIVEAKAKPLELREKSIERMAKVGGMFPGSGTSVSVSVDLGGKRIEADGTEHAQARARHFRFLAEFERIMRPSFEQRGEAMPEWLAGEVLAMAAKWLEAPWEAESK